MNPFVQSLESRQHLSGTPVTTFGTNGYEYVADTNDVTRTAVLSNGEILVLTENPQFGVAVTRLKNNGHIDRTFGNDGHVVLVNDGALGSVRLGSLLVDSEGRIDVILGSTVERLKSDGRRDARFGRSGYFYASSVDGFALSQSGESAIDSHGNLYLTGTLDNNDDTTVILSITSSAKVNTAIGSGGLLYNYTHVVVGDDGNLYAGNASGVSRIKDNGSVDTSFARKGILHDVADPNGLTTFAVDAHGDVYLGETGDTDQIAEFSKDGKLVTSFGIDGHKTIVGRASQILPTPSGGVLISAGVVTNGGLSFAGTIEALKASGKTDTSFGSNGTVSFPSAAHATLYDPPQLSIINSHTVLVNTTNDVLSGTLYHKSGETTVAELTITV